MGVGTQGTATAATPRAAAHTPPYPHRPDGALFYYIAIYGVVTLPPQQPRVPSVPRDEGARGVGEELGPVVGQPT